MSKKEITWSLMHPTPLDVDYFKRVIEMSKKYRVDSFEICGDCHSLGGLEGFLDYAPFPETSKQVDKAYIARNTREFKQILALAHAAGKPVYYWHREIMTPNGIIRDINGLVDTNNEFQLLSPQFEKLLRYKLSETFRVIPELDGLVLTLTESDYSVIHNSDIKKYPPEEVVRKIVEIFADEHEKRGKRFILRSFGSIEKDYEDILAGAALALKKYHFEIETKITPYDFDPFLPVNPFLRKLDGATLGAECDVLGEFLGAGYLPAENTENIFNYVKTGKAAGVDRYALRLDRIGNSIFDCYEINLYTYMRAIDDENISLEQIRREWAEQHYPPEQRKYFLELGKRGFEFVCKNNFLDGTVIFHQFPIGYDLKFVKAAFVSAMFQNNISLENGKEIWSVLSNKNTPGRTALIKEKEDALTLAEKTVSELNQISVPDEYSKELEWRKRLWSNAVIAAKAYLAFTKCFAAYFNDMEAGFETPSSLKKTVTESCQILQSLANQPLKKHTVEFTNGLQHHLFRKEITLDNVYLNPLYNVFNLLLEEYDAEIRTKKKFASKAFDSVIFGGIYDDWRCARSMHASHSTIIDGLTVRIIGNRVFPNGYVELKMRVPAGKSVLRIYGRAEITPDFLLVINGQLIKCSFNSSGVFELPLETQGGFLPIRIEKRGNEYPQINAFVINRQ